MDIIKIFTANGTDTNINLKRDNENLLFRASDVGLVLDIKNIRSTIQTFNEDEKVVVEIDTPGGRQNVNFVTELGLYLLVFKSSKDIAKQFQKWAVNVLKEIRITGKYELENKLKNYEDNNKILEAEIERLSVTDGSPIVYIFNTDTRHENSPLKIGVTEHIRERTKPYKTTHPYGRIVFSHSIPDTNMKTAENWIFTLLNEYRIRGEMFDISVDEAKMWITREINSLNISHISNTTDKLTILAKITDRENQILCNDEPRVSTIDVSTQTDDIKLEEVIEKKDNNKPIFDQFISECCDLKENNEVSSHDITGQFRLWSKKTDKELYYQLLDYLKTEFCPIRLKLQNSDHVLNGFRDIKLKAIEYKKSLLASDQETFIFEVCVFTPSGKVLKTELESEYALWKKKLKKSISKYDNQDLKNFLNECPYTLPATVWTHKGNGLGYYGIHLKYYENYAKKISSTAKPIQKRTINHEIVDSWSSIAKAAEAEGISASKMSRIVKDKTNYNEHYFLKSE